MLIDVTCLTIMEGEPVGNAAVQVLYLGSALVGLAYGGFWSLVPCIVSEIFGLRQFAAIYKCVVWVPQCCFLTHMYLLLRKWTCFMSMALPLLRYLIMGYLSHPVGFLTFNRPFQGFQLSHSTSSYAEQMMALQPLCLKRPATDWFLCFRLQIHGPSWSLHSLRQSGWLFVR